MLGALIVVVLAVLVFNFFNKHNSGTPQIDSQATQAQDVSKNNLPGKYTVKSGDTLFKIAQSYYNNGHLFQKIADSNKLSDPNSLNVGQVLEIPKLGPSATASPSPSAVADESGSQSTQYVEGGTGGAPDQTIWGERITSDTYTVQEGDWLSKIAGRAYGDIYAYTKIAQANNIANPDEIEPGTVLKIPR